MGEAGGAGAGGGGDGGEGGGPVGVAERGGWGAGFGVGLVGGGWVWTGLRFLLTELWWGWTR